MGRLLVLFVALPAVELVLLIEIGQRIGTVATLALIVLTGIAGALMARSQGLRLLSRVREQVSAGEMPADSLLDGLMILIASALLVTPGVLTDACGFLCLVPAFRALVKRELVRRFQRAVEENRVQVSVQGGLRFYDTVSSVRTDHEPQADHRVVDVTPVPDDEDVPGSQSKQRP